MHILKTDFETIEPYGGICGYSRELIKRGEDENIKLEIYRGDMLCLTARTIGEAAKLENNGTDFIPYRDKRVRIRPEAVASPAGEFK